MKIYISYFYQLRFFPRNAIPLSTAVYDPAWFHDGTRDQKHKFKDKRGVINGLRAEPFMPGAACEGLCHGPEYCDLKLNDAETFSPIKCSFCGDTLFSLICLILTKSWRDLKSWARVFKIKRGFLKNL